MKKIIFRISILFLSLFVGCTDEVEFSSDTEALGEFSIITPINSTSYALNSGTPDNTIVFDWLAADPGVSKTPTYTLSFFKVDEEVSFRSFESDNEGTLNKLTATFSDIDQALNDAGFSPGEKAAFQWQVFATNGDVEMSTSKNNITITRFADNGISAFNLLSPANNNSIKADIYGSPNAVVDFTWEEAITTSGTGTIEYTVLFDNLDGDFSNPLKSFPVSSGTAFQITHQEIGDNFANDSNVKWTINAKISGEDIELNADEQYINWDIFVINELYLVGSHNGWDNSTATAFVSNGNGGFELQLDLPADAQFKFLPQQGSWDGDWGEDGANPGKIIQDGEQNIQTVNAGKYIITVDFPTLSFKVEEFKAPDNLFMVGSQNGWNNADPTQQFNNDGNGLFTKVQQFDAGAEFKLLPISGSWDGDWGEDGANPGSIIQDGESNININSAGNYLVIVDFNTLTFSLTDISTLYMVGSQNGWNNADSTQQFNTSGNGVFTRVQTFDAGAEFKLLPTFGSWDGDWGEDGANPGRIIVDGESNIKVSNAGTYVITIDFNTLSFNLKEAPDNLYLVGSPNGWDNTTAPAFTEISEGVFELSQTLSSSDEFKFLPVQGSWDNDWGESKIYSGMIVRDDENNVKSPGDGTYTITVDFNQGTVSVL